MKQTHLGSTKYLSATLASRTTEGAHRPIEPVAAESNGAEALRMLKQEYAPPHYPACCTSILAQDAGAQASDQDLGAQ